MKKILLYVERTMAPGLMPLFEETIHFSEEPGSSLSQTLGPDWVRIIIYVPDLVLEETISKLKTRLEETETRHLIEVDSPDVVISPELEVEKKKAEAEQRAPEKPLIEKLVEETEEHTRIQTDTVILGAIAAIVALIGLFFNNVGIVIGAMLIAPFLGPIHALAINTAIGNVRNVLGSARVLGALLLMVIGFSLLTTAALSLVINLPLTPEITARMTASPVYILMAILLGFAAIVALSHGIPEGVAGVAVAAAMLPPAVVTGVAIVLKPSGALYALILTLQNVIGLITGAILAVIALRIGPRTYYEQWLARQFTRRLAWILGMALLILLIISLLLRSGA
jgi:uncharacterized hydrophobic protein (TIGR00341 family)